MTVVGEAVEASVPGVVIVVVVAVIILRVVMAAARLRDVLRIMYGEIGEVRCHHHHRRCQTSRHAGYPRRGSCGLASIAQVAGLALVQGRRERGHG